MYECSNSNLLERTWLKTKAHCMYTCVMASPLCCTSDAPAFRNQKAPQTSEVQQTICKSKAWPWGHWCIITFPQSSLPSIWNTSTFPCSKALSPPQSEESENEATHSSTILLFNLLTPDPEIKMFGYATERHTLLTNLQQVKENQCNDIY